MPRADHDLFAAYVCFDSVSNDKLDLVVVDVVKAYLARGLYDSLGYRVEVVLLSACGQI